MHRHIQHFYQCWKDEGGAPFQCLQGFGSRDSGWSDFASSQFPTKRIRDGFLFEVWRAPWNNGSWSNLLWSVIVFSIEECDCCSWVPKEPWNDTWHLWAFFPPWLPQQERWAKLQRFHHFLNFSLHSPKVELQKLGLQKAGLVGQTKILASWIRFGGWILVNIHLWTVLSN